MHPNEKMGTDCGYCKGKKPDPGSCTWGFGTPRLAVDDYQLMMDRGWRRCGTYVYKYDLEESCCQPYSIMLNVDEFQITKSQRKCLKKFNNFLLKGKRQKEPEMTDEKPDQEMEDLSEKDKIDEKLDNEPPTIKDEDDSDEIKEGGQE